VNLDDMKGKLKEAEGKLTGDETREAEGKGDQAKAGLEDAWDKAKDAADDATR
jgi:uncharacterized protein YjbJ (UPF0337 family)